MDFYTIHESYKAEIHRQLSTQIEELLTFSLPWNRAFLFEEPTGDKRSYAKLNSQYRTCFTYTELIFNSRNTYPLHFYWYTDNLRDFTNIGDPLVNPEAFHIVIDTFERLDLAKQNLTTLFGKPNEAKILDYDTTFKVFLEKGIHFAEGFALFKLKNFQELKDIQNSIRIVTEKWNDPNSMFDSIKYVDRGHFDSLIYIDTVQDKNTLVFRLEWERANVTLLKYIMEEISRNCKTIYEVRLSNENPYT